MPETPRIGIDWGKARIGVAACGGHTSLCHPVTTVHAGRDEVEQLAAIVAEYAPGLVYIGLPLDLRGDYGPSAQFVLGKAKLLASRIAPIDVRLVDERMSTVVASRSLGSVGRNTKSQRGIIDQAAAVEILQSAVDAEQRWSCPAGEPLDKSEDE